MIMFQLKRDGNYRSKAKTKTKKKSKTKSKTKTKTIQMVFGWKGDGNPSSLAKIKGHFGSP